MPPGLSAPDPAAPTPTTRLAQVRTFFLDRWAGRLIGLGGAVKLVLLALTLGGDGAGKTLQVISSIGGACLAVGVGIVLYGLINVARRHLLWRVRRKLILSYIFIGVVPALLIVTFFVLIGLLLFANLSSYLIRAELREFAADATLIAHSAALEIGPATDLARIRGVLDRRQAAALTTYPGFSLAVVPLTPGRCNLRASPLAGRAPSAAAHPTGSLVAPIAAGLWQHQDAPRTLPDWIPCEGFSGLLAYQIPLSVKTVETGTLPNGGADDMRMLVRGVSFPDGPAPGFAVIVDLPVTEVVKARLQDQTTIEIGPATLVAGDDPIVPARGRSMSVGQLPPPAATAAPARKFRFPSVAVLDLVDWNTGQNLALALQIGMNAADIYGRLSSAQGSRGKRIFVDLLTFSLLVVAGLFLIIQAGALGMGMALARSITGSVHELFAGTERVRQGDFGHRITVRARDQLGELADSFNSMTASIEDLLRQQQEKKRLEEEMRLAREIQTSLLPSGPLSSPGLDIAAVCVPAREVGGDYYDVLPLRDGRVGLLVADVSGKGMSAALYMAEMKGLILSLSEIHQSPRDLLIAANRIISHHLDSRSFITMTYAVFDPAAHAMTYARAGHTPLIVLQNDAGRDRRAQLLAPDGMVVGLRIDDGERFEALLQEETLRLAHGDLLVFFTDGISEAMNAESDCFGEPRLCHLVEEHGHLTLEELRERILREIDAFVGGAPQHDDMTMILVKIPDHDAPAEGTPRSASA
jgi:sigma-B regulation protein RsbU (phosphoserine phosphatase)